MKRRIFLKYGAVGGAVLVMGGVGLSLRRGPQAPLPPEGLKSLTPRQWSTLVALASVVVGGPAELPSAEEAGVAASVDRLLATLDPDLSGELALVLDLLENPVAGALLDGRPAPFSALEPSDRLTAVAAWRSSRLKPRKAGMRALVALINSAYWSRTETWAHMGYTGPPKLGAAP